MKKGTIFFPGIKVVLVLFCFGVFSAQGFAQNNEAKAQPVKKTTNTTTNTTGNAKVAPWEKQPIQPENNHQAATKTTTNTRPEQAQPIRHNVITRF